MSDLIVIVYPSEAAADEVRQRLLGLQREYLIEVSDAVIAVKQDGGRIKLSQLTDSTAVSAITGGFWGLLIGSIVLMPVLGASLGVASGALSGALSDYGIDDGFMKKLAAELTPGSAALFLLIRKMTADKVLEALEGTGGEVLQTSLDHAKEDALREALETSPGYGSPRHQIDVSV